MKPPSSWRVGHDMTRSENRSFRTRDPGLGRRGTARDSGVFVPRRCTLDGFSAEVSRAKGISLAALGPITSLWVQTQNTVYEVTVPRPPSTRVFVRGGRFFPETTEASFGGSSFGGTCLKLGWFGIGLHLEFRRTGKLIVTSRVRSIEILDSASLPGPF